METNNKHPFDPEIWAKYEHEVSCLLNFNTSDITNKMRKQLIKMWDYYATSDRFSEENIDSFKKVFKKYADVRFSLCRQIEAKLKKLQSTGKTWKAY